MSSNIVLWLGVILIALICIVWLVQNIRSEHITLQKIENELTGLQHSLNNACRSYTYMEDYYPKFNDGNLVIQDLQVCMDSSSCNVLYYESDNNSTEKIGDDVWVNDAYACSDLSICRVLYYDSTYAPEFYADKIKISMASICDEQVISRCRLLLCSVDTTTYVELDKIVYLKIEKDSNDRFNFTPN